MRRIAMVCVAAIAGGLSARAMPQSPGDTPLIDTGWTVTTLTGATALAEAYVAFSAQGDLTGRGGCNRLVGGYIARDDGAFLAARVATTMMACEPAAMEMEQKVLAMLEAARGWRIEGQILRLTDAAGAELASFTAGPAPQ